VDANISHTLEFFYMDFRTDRTLEVDNTATALASCHRLKSLGVRWGMTDHRTYGLQAVDAIATGCPLLTDAALSLSIEGIHHVATRCPQLARCRLLSFNLNVPSNIFLRLLLLTSYPKINWL
jgi:hypothetical protein